MSTWSCVRAHPLVEIGGNRPAQARVVHVDPDDAPAGDVRRDSAPGRFDFREFRHPGILATKISAARQQAVRSVAGGVCERCDYGLTFAIRASHHPGTSKMVVRFPLRAFALALAFATAFPALAAEAVSPPAQPAAPGPEVELDADLFYRLLLGDVALQRGELAGSARS
jgi:hypothetical protein